MFTLVNTESGIVVSTENTWGEVLSKKDGTLAHYTTSDVEGEIVPLTTKVVKGDSKLFKTNYITFDELRRWRSKELSSSDWRATIDYPNEDQQAWLDYRNKLRDIPQDYSKVEDVIMPNKPK